MLSYTPYEIYGDPNESTIRMAHSTAVCLFSDNAPLFKDSTTLKSELEYDQRLQEANQRTAYHQGLLDNCHDGDMTETHFLEAQAPLKPQSIRRFAQEDWKRQQKYVRNLNADIVQRPFKYII